MANAGLAAGLGLALSLAGQGAVAELRVCNETQELQSVALGFKGADDWTSRGWWNIQPGDCATVVEGRLSKRYYYYFADSPSGTFRGQNYHFCADDRVFEIVGDADCVGRGHQRLNFREIDVGDTAKSYTLTLQASKSSGAGAGVKAPGGGASSGGGLGSQLVSEAPAPVDLGVDMASLTTQLAPGRHGEPFTLQGLFQGCELHDGRATCAFYVGAEKVRVFYGGPTPDDLLFALEAMPVNAPVEVEGDTVERRDATRIVVVRAVRPASQGDPFAASRAALQGDWVSEADRRSEITIRGSEIYVRYDEKLQAVRILELAQRCQGSSGPGPVVLQRAEGSRKTSCYDLVEAGARLELRPFVRGDTLRFRRP